MLLDLLDVMSIEFMTGRLEVKRRSPGCGKRPSMAIFGSPIGPASAVEEAAGSASPDRLAGMSSAVA
ncbi:MAG TPA: hypothetical protein PK264_22000, partial [Hyphomicrobiaceae bacterium]|nr:hypothetical protein [Hyphomicrobiaceae bacterium]